MLSRNLDIRCQRCGGISSLGSWNDETYSLCVTREMRRTFTELTKERAFKRESDTFYKCPICGQLSRGSQLIIESDDIKLRKLGRESIITRTY